MAALFVCLSPGGPFYWPQFIPLYINEGIPCSAEHNRGLTIALGLRMHPPA